MNCIFLHLTTALRINNLSCLFKPASLILRILLTTKIFNCPGRTCICDRLLSTFRTYPFYGLSRFLVVFETYSIVAVLQLIFRDPLSKGSVSPLRRNPCDSCVLNIQINLEPWTWVLWTSGPRPCFAWGCLEVKSSLDGGMNHIHLWRWGDLLVKNLTVFHSKGFMLMQI